MYRLFKSQIFVSRIFYGYPIPVRQGPLRPWEPCGAFGPELPRPTSHHPLPLVCDAPQSQPLTACDRPPRRGLPRPNCHSHWLISYTLPVDIFELSSTFKVPAVIFDVVIYTAHAVTVMVYPTYIPDRNVKDAVSEILLLWNSVTRATGRILHSFQQWSWQCRDQNKVQIKYESLIKPQALHVLTKSRCQKAES